MRVAHKADTGPPNTDVNIGPKLKYLRETVRKMSPEELAARTGGEVSASYIRRVEKGLNNPTVEMLYKILTALGTTLGAFFDDTLDQGSDIALQDRKYQRVLQRALDEKALREEVIAVVRLIEHALWYQSGFQTTTARHR